MTSSAPKVTLSEEKTETEMETETETEMETETETEMALLAMTDDALGIVLEGLFNPLEPRNVVYFGSTCRGLRALTRALRLQLRAERCMQRLSSLQLRLKQSVALTQRSILAMAAGL